MRLILAIVLFSFSGCSAQKVDSSKIKYVRVYSLGKSTNIGLAVPKGDTLLINGKLIVTTKDTLVKNYLIVIRKKEKK